MVHFSWYPLTLCIDHHMFIYVPSELRAVSWKNNIFLPFRYIKGHDAYVTYKEQVERYGAGRPGYLRIHLCFVLSEFVAIDNAEHDESAAAKQLCAQITKEWASQCPGKITRIPAGIAFAGHTTSASVVQQDEPQKSQGQRFYFVRTLTVTQKKNQALVSSSPKV